MKPSGHYEDIPDRRRFTDMAIVVGMFAPTVAQLTCPIVMLSVERVSSDAKAFKGEDILDFLVALLWAKERAKLRT